MEKMGSYSKAFHARDLAAFPGWRPDLSQLRPGRQEQDGREVEVRRDTLADDDILFLQENLAVTDGIFMDEHVVFAPGGEEWARFCTGTLGFSVPDYAVAETSSGSGPAGA